MKQYHDLVKKVMDVGVDRPDRTGVGTRAIFGQQMRFDLQDGFPALTTKRLFWKAVVSELLWFIEGSGDERRLREIQHGEEDSKKTTIWTQNAESDYWSPKAKYTGDLGRVYGVQWRNWQMPQQPGFKGWLKSVFGVVDTVDQLQNLVDGLRDNPYDRRHILTAWNPGELKDMALPPCHMFSQFFVEPLSADEAKFIAVKNQEAGKAGTVATHKLSCQMYQRSCDLFLGVPFNIASYSLLTHLLAQVLGMEVGEFVWTGGDCHVYHNHFDQANEMLGNAEFPLATLDLNPNVLDVTSFVMDDIALKNYQSHGAIKAPMAV